MTCLNNKSLGASGLAAKKLPLHVKPRLSFSFMSPTRSSWVEQAAPPPPNRERWNWHLPVAVTSGIERNRMVHRTPTLLTPHSYREDDRVWSKRPGWARKGKENSSDWAPECGEGTLVTSFDLPRSGWVSGTNCLDWQLRTSKKGRSEWRLLWCRGCWAPEENERE